MSLAESSAFRHSTDFASWKDRKVLVGALKPIYRAKDATPPSQRWTLSTPAIGSKNIRSRRAGDAIGSASFRSSPFRRPSGGSEMDPRGGTA